MDKQYVEQAAAIAAQAQAIANGKVAADRLQAQVNRLLENVQTLKAWTPKQP